MYFSNEVLTLFSDKLAVYVEDEVVPDPAVVPRNDAVHANQTNTHYVTKDFVKIK